MGVAETAHLLTELDLKDGLSGGLARASGAVGRFGKSTNEHFARVSKGAGQMAGGIARIGAIAGTVAVGGLIGAAKATATFGDEMNIINTIAQKTPAQLDAIGAGIKGLSSDTGADLSDLTAGYYDLLSAGIKVKDAQGDLNLAYRLGRGALATTSESVDFLTTAINSYGIKAKDVAGVADMFAQSVADGKTKLSEIAATFADVAPIAAQAGIGINEVAAAYGFLTQKGATAGSVTTQMSRAIIELAKPGGALKQLEGQTRKSYAAIAARDGLVPALQQMRDDAKKAGIPFIELFGRVEAYKFALQTTGKNLKDFNKEQQNINTSAGALSKQYDERQQGLSYQFQRLAANAKVAAISIGSGFAPALGRAADKLSKYIKDHDKDLVGLGKKIGQALDGIDWGMVADGVKTIIDLFKGAYEIVKLIPPQIAIVGAGLLGINKLSGGLLGAGATNIVGGLVGAVTKGIAAKVPGIGSFVAQPVYVTNWPLGGLGGAGGAGGVGGGGMSRLAKAGTALAVVAVGVELAATINDFMNDRANEQRDLQAKADGLRNDGINKNLTDITNMTRLMMESQGADRVGIQTFASKQLQDALRNVGEGIVNHSMNGADRAEGLQKLIAAQQQAMEYGWTDLAKELGTDIERLKNKTPGAEAIGKAVNSHQSTGRAWSETTKAVKHLAAQTAREARVTRLHDKAMAHITQVDTHKGNAMFAKSMRHAAEVLEHGFEGGSIKNASKIKEAIHILSREQKRALALGHTKLARNLGKDITTMKTLLGRKQDSTNKHLNTIENQPTTVKVTTNVNTAVSVRETQSAMRSVSRYGFAAS